MNISNDSDISSLFKNFDQELPRTRNITPLWDVTLVLRYLQQAPFEPLEKASFKDLTFKTVFLLALASAKRVSELHGLSYVVSRKRHWSEVTLSFAQDFVAKTQTPGIDSTALQTFRIPALQNILDPNDSDVSLCPVCVLKEYITRTENLDLLAIACSFQQRLTLNQSPRTPYPTG